MDHKVDIFALLGAIDRKDRSFYDSLTEEQRASIPMVVVMRWLSGTKDPRLAEYYLQAVNEIVNRGFWDLYQHPKLQFQLMTLVGTGRPTRHDWLAGPKKAKADPLRELIATQYPQANDRELDILRQQATKEDIHDIAYRQGWEEKDIARLLSL